MSTAIRAPWNYRDRIVRDAEDYYVCEIVGAAANPFHQTNAHLITAAPDLLKALKAYVDWFGAAHQGDCPEDDTCECDCKPLNSLVNAAIRKAEGREP